MYKNNRNDNFKKSFNNKSDNYKNTQKSVFEVRYDDFFGKGTFNKLLEFQRLLSKNEFVRCNLSKMSESNMNDFFKKNRIKFFNTCFKNGFKIEKTFFKISSSIESLVGDVYIQDLASQVPVNLVDFKKLKDKNKVVRVLDMCASPGSKTTQIVDLLNFNNINYELVALEPEKTRIQRLINNLQKQNCTNVKIFNVFGQDFHSKDKFDLILLDAPCSGNLIDDTSWLKKRNMMGIEQNAKIQKELLKNAKDLLDVNGQLIYSTCSMEPEENELNVEWTINKLKLKTIPVKFNFGFKTEPILEFKGKKLNDSVKNSIRFMPYNSKTQGFFVCIFER